MITLKLRRWRSAGIAATTLGLAACGAGDQAASPPRADGVATPPATEDEGGEAGETAGGEQGEAGVATAYAGLTGDTLTALRIQHLRGFVMAASKVAEGRGAFGGDAVDAAILVQQGLLEVYDAAPDQFGSLDIAPVREAASGVTMTREQMGQQLRAAEAELTRAMGQLDYDDAQLVVRMIDISTGLYQHVLTEGGIDPTEYMHSFGAALAAQQSLSLQETTLRSQNAAAYDRAVSELNRFVALWPSRQPDNPATYQQVLVQGSRVRLALSPYL